MKRMFVYVQFHGKGVGRALAEAIINEAKTLGYQTMRLDTSNRQNEAKGLINAWVSRPSSLIMSCLRT
jgi:GNAT superfamily N-acetyltransferase